MNNYILDTNVVSELIKSVPDPQVLHFLSGLSEFWISSITIHELHYGVKLLPEGRRKEALRNKILEFQEQCQEYILGMGDEEAIASADIRVIAQSQGRIIHVSDSLIGGTALVHGLTVVTRNIKDFEEVGVELVNPWE